MPCPNAAQFCSDGVTGGRMLAQDIAGGLAGMEQQSKFYLLLEFLAVLVPYISHPLVHTARFMLHVASPILATSSAFTLIVAG